MVMKTTTGDIIKMAEEGKFDVIIHGCNCESLMKAGLSLQIKNAYPEVEQVDAPVNNPGDKLGGVTGVSLEDANGSGNVFTILNGYTQLKARGSVKGESLVDYDAVRSVFKTVAQNFSGQRIAYPKIGAGRAGGNWPVIQAIINEELQGMDHTLVLYQENPTAGTMNP